MTIYWTTLVVKFMMKIKVTSLSLMIIKCRNIALSTFPTLMIWWQTPRGKCLILQIRNLEISLNWQRFHLLEQKRKVEVR